ncbi:hypothetical protein F3087_12915 [Nocardia colli]|uniref:Uncharacterized protein n=1 Tax=Nocardia colli TaxID=2545717 RepID=A0A5N0EGL4_9NOCA|nr:hypothetical protein [Nocardia colli]KAA8887980.1 hypothetical protein F3087_12915 [Nocardia colli]
MSEDGGTPTAGQDLSVVREIGEYVYALSEVLRNALDCTASQAPGECNAAGLGASSLDLP